MSEGHVTTLRLPESLLLRADALVEALVENGETAMLLGRLSRSSVLRLAVLRGLEVLEAQAFEGTSKSSKKRKGPR